MELTVYTVQFPAANGRSFLSAAVKHRQKGNRIAFLHHVVKGGMATVSQAYKVLR